MGLMSLFEPSDKTLETNGTTIQYCFERDGKWWVATAIETSGAFSQGKTIEEARANLLDAAKEMIFAQRQLAEK
jgi:predicted RNase H-like HicB family nuclease